MIPGSGLCVRTMVTFTKLLYKQFTSVPELSGELSSEKIILDHTEPSLWRGVHLFLSPAPGSVGYLNSVSIYLLPRMGMFRVEKVTSAARNTRRTDCKRQDEWRVRRGWAYQDRGVHGVELSNCSLAWSDCD